MTVLSKARSLAARRRARRAELGDIQAAQRDDWAVGNASQVADSTAGTADGAGAVAGLADLGPPDWRLPERLRGRDDLLARLHALLWAPDGRTHVLAGPGGAGKTAIALRLAREAARRGVPAWWVPATDAQTVTVRLLELAARIGARPGELAPAKAAQRGAPDLLWRYLERRTPWLLVIDGADDLAALAVSGADAASGTGWIRRTQLGVIVVTSRVGDRSAWGRHTEVHAVGSLDPAAGGQVLANLAPQGRAVLRVLSCLAPGVEIPGAMLDLGVLARVCEGEPGKAGEALGTLSAAGLITAGQDPGQPLRAVSVYPMVGQSSRVCTGDAERAGGVAVAMLAAAAGALTAGEPGDWPAWVRLLPHVNALYGYLGGRLGREDLAALSAVAAAVTSALLHAGYHMAAAELGAAALRHAGRLGADHPTVLGLRNGVARGGACLGLGNGGLHKEAERELRDLLAAQVRVLGADHPDTLGTGHQLARLLARHGQHEPAEQRLRGLLADYARTLGPDHPSTLTARHDFGLVLAQRGQYAQAAREFTGLLAARVRALGPGHRDTHVTRRWLAHVTAEVAAARSDRAAPADATDRSG